MIPVKQQILEALKAQKEMFGDELFRKTLVSGSTQSQKKEPPVKVEKKIIASEQKQNPVTQVEKKSTTNSPVTLEKYYREICECLECPLGKTRKKFVFGDGNPNAKVMLVGEGPGADEDEQGIPFVGRAGQLLTKIIEAISFKRDEVYIANIVKCRPPGNRTPNPDEIESCIPYLYKQIEIIQPKLILCLGTTAATSLLKQKASLAAMRNKVHKILLPGQTEEIQVVVTYHPAALLRNPNWKKDCWADVQFFRKLYDELFA